MNVRYFANCENRVLGYFGVLYSTWLSKRRHGTEILFMVKFNNITCCPPSLSVKKPTAGFSTVKIRHPGAVIREEVLMALGIPGGMAKISTQTAKSLNMKNSIVLHAAISIRCISEECSPAQRWGYSSLVLSAV